MNGSTSTNSFLECPVPGAGVHSWILRAAHHTKKIGLPEQEASILIKGRMTRPPKGREVEEAIEKAYQSKSTGSFLASVKEEYNQAALEKFVQNKPEFCVHSLASLSPRDPSTLSAPNFLSEIYHPGERVAILSQLDDRCPTLWEIPVEMSEADINEFEMEFGSTPEPGLGAWFLINPVTGNPVYLERLIKDSNPDGETYRAEENITNFRYLLLESDVAPADLWLRALVHLPLPIVSIVSSGGRSFHALVRVAANSSEDWKKLKARLAPALVTLGADLGAMSSVRSSRLPFFYREEKKGWQELLYLNPKAAWTPIIDGSSSCASFGGAGIEVFETFAKASNLPVHGPITAKNTFTQNHAAYRAGTLLPPPGGDFCDKELKQIIDNKLPIIYLPSDLTKITESSISLTQVLSPTLEVFVRNGKLVGIKNDIEGKREIYDFPCVEFRSFVENHVNLYKKILTKSGEVKEKPARMSEDNAKTIMSCRAGNALLPKLQSIINFPRLQSDGSLVSVGYDAESEAIVAEDLSIDFPDTPEEAARQLMDLFVDFRFAKESDFSRAIAAFLAPALRLGPWHRKKVTFPIFAIEADASQTGKGTLVKAIAGMYGETPSLIAATRGGVGSLDESLSRQALRGRPILQIDNLRGRLDSQFLESFVTATGLINARALRRDGEVDTKNIIIYITSNGMDTTTDITNRTMFVRLRKQPPDYSWNKWPDGSLLDHIDKNRSKYLGCVYKILKSWLECDSPSRPCRHDVRDVAGAFNWIVMNYFNLPSIDEDHTEIQSRVNAPGLTFLRQIALCLKNPAEKISTNDMITIAVQNNIDIFGIKLQPENNDDWDNALRHVGRNLAPIFASNQKIDVDGFTVEKKVVKEPKPGNGSNEKKYYLFVRKDHVPPARAISFTQTTKSSGSFAFGCPPTSPTSLASPELQVYVGT